MDILGLAAMTDALLDWIDDGAVHPLNLQLALRNFNMLLGIYTSALEHRPAELPFAPGDDLVVLTIEIEDDDGGTDSSGYEINVNNPKEGKTVRATINGVIENDADPNYVRRNIVTKGAVVDTDIGRVRVTSRPGMHGVVSGVLLED